MHHFNFTICTFQLISEKQWIFESFASLYVHQKKMRSGHDDEKVVHECFWRFHCITNDAISLRRARRSKNGILVERVEFHCTMAWIWISISCKYFSKLFDTYWCFFIYQILQKSHFWNMIWMLQSGVKKFIC